MFMQLSVPKQPFVYTQTPVPRSLDRIKPKPAPVHPFRAMKYLRGGGGRGRQDKFSSVRPHILIEGGMKEEPLFGTHAKPSWRDPDAAYALIMALNAK
jgi:hypothetical protein